MQSVTDASEPLEAGLRAWPGSRSLALVGARTAFCMTMLSALLYAASFPPLSLAFAAWFALVPLLVAASALSPLRAAAAGMLWALIMAGGVAWYLPGMLSGYFGLPGVLSWAAALAIVVGLTGTYVGAYAAWVSWLARRHAASPLLLAGGWLACEFARAHGLLPNPWALSAYSQMQATRLMQIADATGPYGVGILIAAVNASLAAMLAPALRGRRFISSLLAVVAALAGVLLYGQWRLGQAFGDGQPIAVAIVQGGTPPSPPEQPALRPARLERYVALTRDAAGGRPDLIVWPEYAVESYLEEASAARDAVLGVAAEAGADVILGGPHYAPALSGTRYHNSVFLIHGGRLAARYDKNLLVPFAEDNPLEWPVGRKGVRYSPGRGGAVLPATHLRVGVFLCLESMFPEFVRTVAREGAEILVNLSNDSWFGHADPARQQLDSAALRAIENRRYLVRATPTGFSAVIDPHGRTIVRSGFNAPEVLTASVRASHARSPYQRWGDAFSWLVVAAVTGATFGQLVKRTARLKIGR